MSKFNGKYQFVKSENFVEVLVAGGMPEADAKAKEKEYITSLNVDGSKITFTLSDGKTLTFNDGAELDLEGMKVSFKLDGNTLRANRTFTGGHVWNTEMVFNDNGFEELNKDASGKVHGKRIFKRI